MSDAPLPEAFPYPEPQSREQARANAIHFATDAHESIMPETRAIMAQMWSAIAMTFPEESVQVVDNLSDLQAKAIEAWDEAYQAEQTTGQHAAVDTNGNWLASTELEQQQTAIMDEAVTQGSQPQRGVAVPSAHGDGRIMVDAVSWDVLRALAIRFMLQYPEQGATVQPFEYRSFDWDVVFVMFPDSNVVSVGLEHRGP